MMKKEMQSRLTGWKPALTMVLVEIALAGVTILYKLAVDIGMNLRVVVVYRLLLSTASSLPLALIFESWNDWEIGWDMGLFIVSYSGIVGYGVTVTLIAWCVQVRGPVYLAAFNPLLFLLVFFMGTVALDENLFLGRIVEAILIVRGLYILLWGKHKEDKEDKEHRKQEDQDESDGVELL
ncbi:WAT1-related protein At1g25270 [Ziziphus jujuba]|uniref:WAT1-related protein At1g25270 n=1 Tax=Ziziphus jujuba TaxID=326968 RepID=A0ABM4A6P5_ZIZJJ|nr:WAT1-related protein At1g25270 [Ziziphus jujuba]